MPYGFTGKILEVDLSREKIRVREFSEGVYRNWLGGRGLGTYILWKELGDKWEEIDPLGPENLLLILTGPLSGYYPGIKLCITGKSPESNGVVGSTISSEVAIELKAAGYDGMIIRGRAEEPKYILLVDDYVDIKDARKYWGRGPSDFLSELMSESHREVIELAGRSGLPKEPAILYIGRGGERKVRFASIMAKFVHAAGYGGYGAVAGSKNLKAIVVKGNGPLPPVANFEEYKKLLRDIQHQLLEITTFRAWGTGAGGYEFGYRTSSEPIRNWQEEWHDRKEISVVNFELGYWVKKYWGDYGCPVTCMKISYIRHGKYKGAKTDAPDYELAAYLGTNLGIFKPEEIIYLSYLADELGLDAINTGNVLGFAAELYEKEILSKNDVGFELRWGDTDAFAKLMQMIANREGIGDVLAEGTHRAARIIGKIKGIDAARFAVEVKGIAVGAHGIRSGEDYPSPIGYAVSVQGGDHTSAAFSDPKVPAGEIEAVFTDSAVICSFTYWTNFDVLIQFLNSVTGWNMTVEEWINQTAPRIIHIQRLLLLLGGPDIQWDPRVHDDNPPRFYEPLPSGPHKGKKANEQEVNELKKAYYEGIGYDEYGVSKPEVLRNLGLEDAIPLVKKIRNRLGLE
ncbi:MAG: aldehyde ferredoxin oxidoreductase [Crenarchaeota archaeon]|nr:aldehyde ferredoxin oxidoreductase [Thermoproteota archaeon]